MGDHLARGEEYERKAEKKLNSCGWWGQKAAKATNLFRQAAFRFMLAKSWDRAGSAYMEAAKCHLKCKNAYGAAKAYVCAANCYRKTSSKEAVACLEQAVNLFMDVGSLTSAATCYKGLSLSMKPRIFKDLKTVLISVMHLMDGFLGVRSGLMKVINYRPLLPRDNDIEETVIRWNELVFVIDVTLPNIVSIYGYFRCGSNLLK